MGIIESSSTFATTPGAGKTDAISSLLNAASSALRNNEYQWLQVPGKPGLVKFIGRDLSLRLLADGEKQFPEEPVFTLYRAAYSLDHADMRHDKKMHRIYRAAAALERAYANPANAFKISGREPSEALHYCLDYCAYQTELVIGSRLAAAAQSFYPDDIRLARKQMQLEEEALCRREAIPTRPATIDAAALPPAISNSGKGPR